MTPRGSPPTVNAYASQKKLAEKDRRIEELEGIVSRSAKRYVGEINSAFEFGCRPNLPEMTPGQSELLRFIEAFMRSNRVGPSYDEMAVALRLKSRGNVHRLLVGLEVRGKIQRLPNHSRAIRLIYPTVDVRIDGRPRKMMIVPFKDGVREP